MLWIYLIYEDPKPSGARPVSCGIQYPLGSRVALPPPNTKPPDCGSTVLTVRGLMQPFALRLALVARCLRPSGPGLRGLRLALPDSDAGYHEDHGSALLLAPDTTALRPRAAPG